MALSSLYVELKASIADFQSKMGVASKEIKTFEKSNADAASTSNRVGKVATVALAAVAAGAIGVGVEAVKMAGNFQQSMTRLVTGAGESQSNLKLVSDGILDMAGKVGYSTTDLANGMFLVESAGFHGADGLKVLQNAAEGAKADNADLTTVANAVTSALNAYGLKASDSAKTTNILVATAAAGKMSFQDLAGSISAVLPVAATAHISLTQVGGALATMTGQGMSADQAAQNLAFTIRSLQKPSDVAKSEMQQLGLNVTDVSTQLGQRGLTGTLQMVTEAITAHMGPAGTVLMSSFKQSASAADDAQRMIASMPPALAKVAKEFLAGTITTKQYHAEIKGLPADQMILAHNFTAVANKAGGFNDLLKAGSPAAQTYTDALSKIMGGATGLNTTLMLTGSHAKDFANNVKDIGSKATASGQNIEGFAEQQATLNGKLGDAKAALGAFAIQIGNVLLPIATSIIKTLAEWASWMQKHAGLTMTLAGIIGGVLVAAVSAYTVTQLRAFDMSERGMIQDVAKGAVWIAQKTAQFAALVARSLASATAATGAWIAEQAKMVAQTIASGAEWAAGMIAKYAIVVASAIASGAATAAAWVAANIAMIAATGGIVLAIGGLVAAGIWLATHWTQVWGMIKSVAETVWHWLSDNVFHPIGEAVHAVGQAFSDAFTWIQDVLRSVWNFIKPIFDAIGNAIGAVSNAIGGFIHSAGSVIHGIGSFLGFDEGGPVPGAPGQPRLIVAHGGEYVLSRDMIAGRTAPVGLDLAGPSTSGLVDPGEARSPGPASGQFAGAPVTVINVNVAGSTYGNRQLAQVIREQLLQIGARNVTTYQNFAV